MSKQSNPVRDTLLIVGGVLSMLLLFGVVLRAALAPLYQEMAHVQTSGGSSGESGGGSYNGEDGPGSNVDVNLGGVGGLLNWAFGWAWGGPSWYNAGPGGGWWGGNWWNNWAGSWDRNGNWYDGNGNRVYSNDTFNRTVNRNYENTRMNHDDFGGAREDFRGNRAAPREGGGEHFGGGERFHGGGGGGRR
jgi:hypothetical protein